MLKNAKKILFITGAGISAESGLPTYRGIGGLYNNRTTEDGIPIEMALAGEMLQSRPEVTWKYLSQIEKSCRTAKFNRAHEIISEIEKHFENVLVLTQNIDGFHNAAGSRNVIDIHGDMHKLFCPVCGWRIKVNDYSKLPIPPNTITVKAKIMKQILIFSFIAPSCVHIIILDHTDPFRLFCIVSHRLISIPLHTNKFVLLIIVCLRH